MVPIGLVLKMSIGVKDNFTKKDDPNISLVKTKEKKYKLNEEQKKSTKIFRNY